MAIYNTNISGGLNTKDCTADASKILDGYTAGVGKEIVTGTMADNGDVSTAIVDGVLKEGYTSGGTIANLEEGNIKDGVTIAGKTGTYSGGKLITKITSTTYGTCETSGETSALATLGSSAKIAMIRFRNYQSTANQMEVSFIFPSDDLSDFTAYASDGGDGTVYDISSMITCSVSGSTYTYNLPSSYDKYSSYGLSARTCLKFKISSGTITMLYESYSHSNGGKYFGWAVKVYYS